MSKSLTVCIPIGVTWLHFKITVTGFSWIFPLIVSARNSKLLLAKKFLGKLTSYGNGENHLSDKSLALSHKPIINSPQIQERWLRQGDVWHFYKDRTMIRPAVHQGTYHFSDILFSGRILSFFRYQAHPG